MDFNGAFFLAEIFQKVSFDPYNFLILRLSVRKSEQMKNSLGIKICLLVFENTKIRSTLAEVMRHDVVRPAWLGCLPCKVQK